MVKNYPITNHVMNSPWFMLQPALQSETLAATMACTTSAGSWFSQQSGAATATICRIPVLLLPSDYYASRYGGLFFGILITSTLRTCLRTHFSRQPFFDRITRPEQILTTLPSHAHHDQPRGDRGSNNRITTRYSRICTTTQLDSLKRTWRIKKLSESADREPDLLKCAKSPTYRWRRIHYSEAWNELAALAEKFGIQLVKHA